MTRSLPPPDPRAVRVLDTLGALCPIPIVRTAEAIREIAPGAVLEVLSDDMGVLADMPAWCKGTGHTLLEIRREGRIVRCLVQKASHRTPSP